jgi:hypothetical protein
MSEITGIAQAIRNIKFRLATLDSDEPLNDNPARKGNYRAALEMALGHLERAEADWQALCAERRENRKKLAERLREEGLSDAEILHRILVEGR